MKTRLPLDAGIFYSIGQGHAIVTLPVSSGEFELGTKYPLNSMFEMWDLLRDGNPVGYYFYSGFKVENKGGFILTFMESKRGQAQTCSLLIRRPEVMVYDFQGCGALAVSLTVNEQVQSILSEQ